MLKCALNLTVRRKSGRYFGINNKMSIIIFIFIIVLCDQESFHNIKTFTQNKNCFYMLQFTRPIICLLIGF